MAHKAIDPKEAIAADQAKQKLAGAVQQYKNRKDELINSHYRGRVYIIFKDGSDMTGYLEMGTKAILSIRVNFKIERVLVNDIAEMDIN